MNQRNDGTRLVECTCQRTAWHTPRCGLMKGMTSYTNTLCPRVDARGSTHTAVLVDLCTQKQAWGSSKEVRWSPAGEGQSRGWKASVLNLSPAQLPPGQYLISELQGQTPAPAKKEESQCPLCTHDTRANQRLRPPPIRHPLLAQHN